MTLTLFWDAGTTLPNRVETGTIAANCCGNMTEPSFAIAFKADQTAEWGRSLLEFKGGE